MPRPVGERTIRRLVRKWQKILRLQDWRIVVKVVEEKEMTAPGRWAEIGCEPDRLVATMDVRRPAFTKEDREMGDADVEATIVHELLHVPLRGIGNYRDKLKMQLEEQAVERLTAALIELDRRGK